MRRSDLKNIAMTKKEAQEKIRNHILNYGRKKNFVITTRLLNYWWTVLNLAVFGGCLSRPTFIIKNINGGWAECGCQYYINHDGSKKLKKDGNEAIKVTIGIDALKIENQSREVLIAALVHEMIHAWQVQYRTDIIFERRMSHGSTFTQWRDDVENIVLVKLGYNLDENDVTVHRIEK